MRMAPSGVRSSWETTARNSSLALLAASASRRAACSRRAASSRTRVVSRAVTRTPPTPPASCRTAL